MSYIKKIAAVIFAVMFSFSIAAGCMAAENDQTDDKTAEALNAYNVIINNAESYAAYWYHEPEDVLEHALVKVNAEDEVPALLLKETYYSEDHECDINEFLVFKYDPETKEVVRSLVGLMEGYGTSIDQHIYQSEKDDCIIEVFRPSGSDNYKAALLTMDDEGNISSEVVWEGKLEELPEDYAYTDITWNDVPSSADNTGSAVSDSAQEYDDSQITVEEGHIAVRGTVQILTYDEVVAWQGHADPNAQYADTSKMYRLLILDQPQELTLNTDSGMETREVDAFNIITWDPWTENTSLDQYAGESHLYSIDQVTTYFPGGTDIPLGVPQVVDISIIE